MNAQVQKPRPVLTARIWKRDEIFTFLDIFESTFHASVVHPFESETDMWKCISDKLFDHGITASAQHCQNKWNFLYKTYVSNQSKQGAFYVKIKQIVELSKELSDQQHDPEPVTNDEVVETEPVGEETLVEQEELRIGEGQCAEVSTEETLTEHEHLEVLATSNVPEDCTDVQSDIQNNSLDVERAVKRRKVSSDIDTSKQNNDVVMDENVDAKHIQLILEKIEAIHKEQITQGRRMDVIEMRQNENRQILLDIKEYLELK